MATPLSFKGIYIWNLAREILPQNHLQSWAQLFKANDIVK